MPRPLTSLRAVPFVPEISLYLADRPVKLFDATDGEYRSDQPPPFWAFVWAGGQALARFVLDHPQEVAGRRVHDLATGSGIAAVAAALAGAAEVAASDLDPEATAAARRNGEANGFSFSAAMEEADVLLAGDVFYTATAAGQMTSILRAARRRSASVLVGDPGRGHFPERLFEPVAEYVVPVPAALEETEALSTRVWRMR